MTLRKGHLLDNTQLKESLSTFNFEDSILISGRPSLSVCFNFS
jgi:hypothetical protein